ncbi:putative nuclease HARBI1 [Amyelois transitella]|uniref:putative nuclease HARBI1 n=1 Tax=Amyelois transitella TaxID=680683 RepID=UPI00067DDEC6|nr:putative nuclease HARBI1 [Amyelois transitella]
MNTLLKIQMLRNSIYNERITRRILRDTCDCKNLSDSYLLRHCRVNRTVFHQILRILEPVVPKTQRSTGIPFPLKVLVTLSFLASGSHQKSVGNDFNVNISQKSVSRVIKIIIEGLNIVLDNWVLFPSTMIQREKIKEGFYQKYNFPETIGCLDGTCVQIVCPRDDEEAFYDRKGQYSIHAQIICDADTKIIAICCRFGGAASKAYIWNKMNIRPFIENISRQGEPGWLIADSKYPQRPWLMTPIVHAPQGSPEAQYNNFHGRTKICIDRCIGKLKGRWKCLQKRPLHYTPQRAAKIINACAVLHNLCIKAGLHDPILYTDPGPMQPLDDIIEMPNDNVNDFYMGLEVRRQLAERIYFSV